jgi:hypothetical protein
VTALPLGPGCAFTPRVRYVEDRCTGADPPKIRVATDHTARCVRRSAELVAAALAPSCA